MGKTEKYKLTYFNKRGGGEIIRLVFVAAGQVFEDERLTEEQWDIMKPDTPMGNVPVLTMHNSDGGPLIVCQAPAIARYLSKRFDLLGSTDFHHFLIDEVYGCVGDVRQKLVQIYFSRNEPEKQKELKQNMTSVVLPKFNLYLDQRMQAFGTNGYIIGDKTFGTNGYIIGDKISLADLAVFNMVDSCIEMGWMGLWNTYPNILQHRQLVMNNDNIGKWLKSRPKTLV